MDIKKMTESDRRRVYEMMRVFYDSPALIHKSSDAVLKRDIEACLSGNIFVQGYVFRENEEIIGYSMISKSFTTEYGGICVWIEDLYFEEKWRNRGFGSQFFEFLERQYPEAVRFKLEVEKENEAAVATYKKNGYAISDYFLMTKEIDRDE
jgi:GNAT superfamily N-acetyltransferase